MRGGRRSDEIGGPVDMFVCVYMSCVSVCVCELYPLCTYVCLCACLFLCVFLCLYLSNQMTVWPSRLAVELRTGRTGFDPRSQDSEIHISPEFIIINIALADNSTTSLVCISCCILRSPPTRRLHGGASPLSGLVILSTTSEWSLRYDFPLI